MFVLSSASTDKWMGETTACDLLVIPCVPVHVSVGFAGLSVWRALILLVRFCRTPLASLVLGGETWTLLPVDL